MSERLQACQCNKSTTSSSVLNQSKLLDKNRKPLLSRPPLIQTKLTINQPGDRYEQEADWVAEQIIRMPDPVLQRKCSKCDDQEDEVLQAKESPGQISATRGHEIPPLVHEVLRSPGQHLDPATRAFMETRFGHDFSRVRVHSGEAAEKSAREIKAHAYTLGNDIVFGGGRFAPETHEGRMLIAHELTHVVQQGTREPSRKTLIRPVGSPKKKKADGIVNSLSMTPGAGNLLVTVDAGLTLRAKPEEKKRDVKAPPKKQVPKVPKICGRPSTKVPGNWITKVNIDVGKNKLTIEWQDKTKIPHGSGGEHNISPGAGLCCVDCNDEKVSQTSGSLCTPKGGEWPVDYTRCQLSGHPRAKNPTYFQRRDIAIHSGNTAIPPQSHGCTRTLPEIAELIHDNVVPKKTQIASSGTWAGKKCYLKEKTDTLSNRADVCDGNKLKSKNKDKKDKKKLKQYNKPNAPMEIPKEQTPKPEQTPTPVAEVPLVESDELSTVQELESAEEQTETIADGPGPNNNPTSDVSIDEEFIAELYEVEKTGEESDMENEIANV